MDLDPRAAAKLRGPTRDYELASEGAYEDVDEVVNKDATKDM